ncbi:MAG: hypothetical protein JSU83_16420, partial [Deltaproteobacteria bacterium]
MMTTVNRLSAGRMLVCSKGAPETILDLCSRVMDGGSA